MSVHSSEVNEQGQIWISKYQKVHHWLKEKCQIFSLRFLWHARPNLHTGIQYGWASNMDGDEAAHKLWPVRSPYTEVRDRSVGTNFPQRFKQIMAVC